METRRDDEQAKKERAERLRRQIREITRPKPDDAEKRTPDRKKSPRELIHDKMRELDEERTER